METGRQQYTSGLGITEQLCSVISATKTPLPALFFFFSGGAGEILS